MMLDRLAILGETAWFRPVTRSSMLSNWVSRLCLAFRKSSDCLSFLPSVTVETAERRGHSPPSLLRDACHSRAAASMSNPSIEQADNRVDEGLRLGDHGFSLLGIAEGSLVHHGIAHRVDLLGRRFERLSDRTLVRRLADQIGTNSRVTFSGRPLAQRRNMSTMVSSNSVLRAHSVRMA